jgi:undecaprenyl-diphosphatase
VVWLDEKLFFLINGLAGRCDACDSAMTLLGGDYFMPLLLTMVLFALWFWGTDAQTREKHQRAIFATATAIGFASAAVKLINLGFDRLRPFEAYPDTVNLLYYQCTDPSFPANVAAVSFAFAMGTWFSSRKAAVLLLCLGILWSFARVYSGVHYPLDIVGGAAIGILVTFPARWVIRLVEPLPTWILKGMRWLSLA